MLMFSFAVKREKTERLNSIAYNIIGVSNVNIKENQPIVGGYGMIKLDKMPSQISDFVYIMFEVDKKYKTTLFDYYKIHIVKKYIIGDNIVYDCHSDNINIRSHINIQIVQGDNIKIGIPTIFNGF